MSSFKPFSVAVNARLQDFAERDLFKVDTLDIFASYLAAFPEGTNPIFRERTEHDCQCCKQFIRNLGNVIAIVDGEIWTVWDNWQDLPYPYDVVSKAMAELVRQAPIRGVYKTKEPKFGAESNRDNHDPSIVWSHFHGEVPKKAKSRQPDTDRGRIDTKAHVFKRGLNEIALTDLETVIDLIEANNLYRGTEHLASVKEFRRLKEGYNAAGQTDRFVWANVFHPSAPFRNTVIGTLLVDLAETGDLEGAVKRFEAKVAPSNYKRPTALITPKMIEQAVAKLNELGLDGAVERRFARIDDISVTDVLFVDNAVRGKMKGGLTDLLMRSDKVKVSTSGKPTPIKIEDFMALGATSIELVLANNQLGNFVSLTAPEHANTGKLFKWNNDFAWSYDGEIADAAIKERVKAAGGKVTNVALRVSLAWHNSDDLDLHCQPASGFEIYYGNKQGILDVDMNAGHPTNRHDPVENMSWVHMPRDGLYKFRVDLFSKRMHDRLGFTLEVENNGNITQFSTPNNPNRNVHLVIEIRNGEIIRMEADRALSSATISRDKWGIPTLKPVKVAAIMLSPNYWDGAGGVGNKHWFFMLDGCKNPDPVRGIYNEFLRGELEPHRKVFEVLGSKTKCQPTEDQLSGVGFSSTRGDKVIAIADGRTFEVEF